MTSEEITGTQVVESKYHIFKGRFKSNSLNFYGLILLIYNHKKDIEMCQSIISTFSSIYEIEPHLGWEKYQETIVNSKWRGNYNPSMSTSIQETLDAFTSDIAEKLQFYDYMKNGDQDHIDLYMFDMINRIIHDNNLILESTIQEVTAEEYSETKMRAGKPEETSEQTLKSDEGSITLPIQLILAPVSGKPIYELKIGDKIMTRITPGSDTANQVIEQMKLKVEDHIKPVASEVIEIRAASKDEPLEILVQISPGIFGKCYEEERQVKLRMYDPKIDGVILKKPGEDRMQDASTAQQVDYDETGIPKITLLIGGFVIVILILLILMILYI